MEYEKEPGTVITMYLADRRMDGLRTFEIATRTIKATVFPRNALRGFGMREEANQPGVYLLYGLKVPEGEGADTDTPPIPMLYIGEGDPVLPRLENHNREKDFWTEAYVFTSTGTPLDKTKIQYLEAALIAMAQRAGQTLDNSNTPDEPTISETDSAVAKEFLKLILILADAMKLAFFTEPAQEAVAPRDGEVIYEYSVRSKNCFAKMTIRAGQYVVLAGSIAATELNPSAGDTIRAQRDQLLKTGALKFHEDGKLYVEMDIPCDSPSAAASIIYGGNVNGWDAWKNNNRRLKDLARSV